MRLALLTLSLAIFVVAGCKKKEPPAKAPVTVTAPAPSPTPVPPPATAPTPVPEVYKPRYAVRMHEVLDRAHLVGHAAAVGNWGFAHQQAYELLETFRHDLPKVLPATRVPTGVDLKGLRAAFANTQLAALLTATEKKDKASFDKAYSEMIAGCNACHNQTGRESLVLRAKPAKSPWDLIDLKAGAGK